MAAGSSVEVGDTWVRPGGGFGGFGMNHQRWTGKKEMELGLNWGGSTWQKYSARAPDRADEDGNDPGWEKR